MRVETIHPTKGSAFQTNIIQPAQRVLSLKGIGIIQKLGLLFDLFRMPAETRLKVVTTASTYIEKNPLFASQVLRISRVAISNKQTTALTTLSENLQSLQKDSAKELLSKVQRTPHTLSFTNNYVQNLRESLKKDLKEDPTNLSLALRVLLKLEQAEDQQQTQNQMKMILEALNQEAKKARPDTQAKWDPSEKEIARSLHYNFLINLNQLPADQIQGALTRAAQKAAAFAKYDLTPKLSNPILLLELHKAVWNRG